MTGGTPISGNPQMDLWWNRGQKWGLPWNCICLMANMKTCQYGVVQNWRDLPQPSPNWTAISSWNFLKYHLWCRTYERNLGFNRNLQVQPWLIGFLDKPKWLKRGLQHPKWTRFSPAVVETSPATYWKGGCSSSLYVPHCEYVLRRASPWKVVYHPRNWKPSLQWSLW